MCDADGSADRAFPLLLGWPDSSIDFLALPKWCLFVALSVSQVNHFLIWFLRKIVPHIANY